MIYIHTPSASEFATCVVGGALLGICHGMYNHEFTDLRSSIKCGLRSVIFSATLVGTSTVAFAVFALAAVNTNQIIMAGISFLCVVQQVFIGPSIFELSKSYEQRLKVLLDRLF